MRIVLFGFLVAIFCAAALGKPAKSTPCGQACTLDYTPICASPKSGKGADLSFGNKCVLEKYNCEHNDAEYSMKGDGECPGAVGIRLQ